MTAPTLFLRTSEKPKPRIFDGEKFVEGGYNPHAGDSRLVPTLRPGMEFVLEGKRLVERYDEVGRIVGPLPVPVRAFEIIAGDEGRVIEGRLHRLGGRDDGQMPTRWDAVGNNVTDAPWREAWEANCDDYPECPHTNGPVWLVGPSVRWNFYGLSRHELRRPRAVLGTMDITPRTDAALFKQIQASFMVALDLWGIEWRLGDETVAQVTREEIGL